MSSEFASDPGSKSKRVIEVRSYVADQKIGQSLTAQLLDPPINEQKTNRNQIIVFRIAVCYGRSQRSSFVEPEKLSSSAEKIPYRLNNRVSENKRTRGLELHTP